MGRVVRTGKGSSRSASLAVAGVGSVEGAGAAPEVWFCVVKLVDPCVRGELDPLDHRQRRVPPAVFKESRKRPYVRASWRVGSSDMTEGQSSAEPRFGAMRIGFPLLRVFTVRQSNSRALEFWELRLST